MRLALLDEVTSAQRDRAPTETQKNDRTELLTIVLPNLRIWGSSSGLKESQKRHCWQDRCMRHVHKLGRLVCHCSHSDLTLLQSASGVGPAVVPGGCWAQVHFQEQCQG